ncbi:MAG: hypothetical protein LBP19_03790 [Treponema sp.]|jgi:hypothetical protein|nr:hypothetical protein [Treponema sp.]
MPPIAGMVPFHRDRYAGGGLEAGGAAYTRARHWGRCVRLAVNALPLRAVSYAGAGGRYTGYSVEWYEAFIREYRQPVRSHGSLVFKYGTFVLQYENPIFKYGTFVLEYRSLVFKYGIFVLQYRNLVFKYGAFVLQYGSLVFKYGIFVLQYGSFVFK